MNPSPKLSHDVSRHALGWVPARSYAIKGHIATGEGHFAVIADRLDLAPNNPTLTATPARPAYHSLSGATTSTQGHPSYYKAYQADSTTS
ncbi:hypothetical protein HaLaN_04168, partial [Haematococcus lacustris]